MNSADIERCIAKVALCEAVRSIDTTIWDPVLSRFILEGGDDTSEFLGAMQSHEITDNMHHVSHQLMIRDGGGATGILTTVNLFDWLPTPSYQVIIRPTAAFRISGVASDKV